MCRKAKPMNAHKKAAPAGGSFTDYRRDDESETDMKNNEYSTDAASQRQRLLAWLQASPLTTLQARQQLDIMHPAARVQELRERGHNIVLNWVIAFDCFRLLECGGDFNQALKWNPEITQHNQRLFMQEQAKNAPESPQSPTSAQGQVKPLFPLIPASALTINPIAIDWLVENIIERGSLNLLFGEPGAGKSLFALDWAFCMAAGIDWHGYRTKPVGVVVIAGEGFAGMARRLKALEAKHGKPSPDRLSDAVTSYSIKD